MRTDESPFERRSSVVDVLRRAISLLILDAPSRAQLEEALALSEEVVARARETQEWFRTEFAGRVNAATALLDLGRPLIAKEAVLVAIRKARAFSVSAEDRIKTLALLGACERALHNPEAAQAAYEDALRFADRVLAGRALPKDQALPRSQTVALKRKQGTAYQAIMSSIQQHRIAVEQELDELSPQSLASPTTGDGSNTRVDDETGDWAARGCRFILLSRTGLDLPQLIRDHQAVLSEPIGPRRPLERILAETHRIIAALDDEDDPEGAVRAWAHRNGGLTLMRLGDIHEAKAALMTAERLGMVIAVSLRTRYVIWGALIRALIFIGEYSCAARRITSALDIARGLLRTRPVRPREPVLVIPTDEWDMLEHKSDARSEPLTSFLKDQQRQLRQLKARLHRTWPNDETGAERPAAPDAHQSHVGPDAHVRPVSRQMLGPIANRLPRSVLEEWPAQDGDVLAAWLCRHGYDTLDPTLVDRYYKSTSSLNDFLTNVVLITFLPMVGERDRRVMAGCFETGARPYSLLERIEAAVSTYQDVSLTRDDSKTISGMTAAVTAVPHATLATEIRTVLETALKSQSDWCVK